MLMISKILNCVFSDPQNVESKMSKASRSEIEILDTFPIYRVEKKTLTQIK